LIVYRKWHPQQQADSKRHSISNLLLMTKKLQFCKQKKAGAGLCARKLKTLFFQTEPRRPVILDEIHAATQAGPGVWAGYSTVLKVQQRWHWQAHCLPG
jgi:hypothetical protein